MVYVEDDAHLISATQDKNIDLRAKQFMLLEPRFGPLR